ncbi:DinB family protein [Saccharothrix sp. NRRL B-16314]|uniref:DinB family protein n=1 Tax=Saccharothrix sp. NRRL B-16314 TaxID=1463825 RepID=UPI000527CF15|nr:DinB family protein [Saccharothrix sp. NRRL B-16314]
MDKQAVHDDMERARATFRSLLELAGDADLRRKSNGTRWNNRQLLFHMLLGFLIMRALLTLVRLFDRLPTGVGRAFARLLNAATKPFDAVNYAGAWLGGTTLGRRQMAALCDRVIAKLHRRLDRETDTELARGMHYPTRWDPFFQDFMTLADLYRFPVQHFDFHRRQLTLDRRDRPLAGTDSDVTGG